MNGEQERMMRVLLSKGADSKPPLKKVTPGPSADAAEAEKLPPATDAK